MSQELYEEAGASSVTQRVKRATGGAFGAGLVLIVLPSAALVLGLRHLERHSTVGLPIVAIFGIMILFGALSLISTVFARLSLSSKTEALALPPGSIRAAIALSLIVLFAIISVMLYQSLSSPYEVTHLSLAQKNTMVQEPSNRVLGVFAEPCDKAQQGGCTPATMTYTVHLRQSPGPESTDLAKQLLILVGTLMTSVTSFYFASRTAEAAVRATRQSLGPDAPAENGGTKAPVSTPPAAASAPEEPDDHEEHIDGCDAPIENVTGDADLPPAKGGVAS